MTEQEKQAIRDDLNFYTPCTSRESSLEEYCNELLYALDERDRELERYKHALRQVGSIYEWKRLEEENQRLHKALEEIAKVNTGTSEFDSIEMYEIARQALAGEVKG